MNVWLIMIASGIFTFLTRFSFITIFSCREFPPIVKRALRFVPPSVLSVIALQGLFYPDGKFDISFGNTYWIVGLIAGLIAWITRNALLTILAGILCMVVLQLVVHY